VNKDLIDDNESAADDTSTESPSKTTALAVAFDSTTNLKLANDDLIDEEGSATDDPTTESPSKTTALPVASKSTTSLKHLFDDDDSVTDDPSIVSPSKTTVLVIAADLTTSLETRTKDWLHGGEDDELPDTEDNTDTRSSSTVHGDDESTFELRLATRRLSIAKTYHYTNWHCIRCGKATKLGFPRPDASKDACTRCSGKMFLKERKEKIDTVVAR
jgi:DNA-directed RNA polymerase subunit RPC12/RpoP